jgi:hypothetical protein
MRDHQPIVLDKFNGLWDRGNIEETPMDHFSECVNLQYIGQSTFGTRDGIGRHQNVASPLANILRVYNFPTADRNTLLVLTSGGQIYHVLDAATIYGPILTIAAMTDFGFVPYSGRAYITPFNTIQVGGLNTEKGLQNEFVYVYKGDGTAARKAGGTAPTTTITAVNGAAGFNDAGVHIFGYVYETDTGYLTPPGGLVAFTTTAGFSIDFSTIANSPDAFVAKKHLVASKVIQNYNGDTTGYTLYFIPNADIPNNVTTILGSISFFDADLLSDASHLLDNFSSLAAGVNLCVYHNRLCLVGEYANTSIIRVSAPGEPEAISQIDGLCLVPPDGNPLTNVNELRDVLYAFKRHKTVSFVDNGDIPTSWPITTVDNAMGCGVHGLGTVLDSGASNIDYFLVGSYKGLTLFNGRYILPELSWKIQNLWTAQDFKTRNRVIQIINDPVQSHIYVVLTDNRILYGDYSSSFDPKAIRWCPWQFDVRVNSIALINISELILGCDQAV